MRNIRASQSSLAPTASRYREAELSGIHFVQSKLTPLYSSPLRGLEKKIQLRSIDIHIVLFRGKGRKIHYDYL